jgi:hypothetical protein
VARSGQPHGIRYGKSQQHEHHLQAATNGMAKPGDGNDVFSDNDLDTLSADTLAELEQTAAQLTQRNLPRFDPQALQQQLQQTYQTLPTLPSTRAQTGGFFGPNSRHRPVIKHADLPSSDYGNFDEEALQAELLDALDPSAVVQDTRETVESKVFGETTQREQSYRNGYSNVSGAERSRFSGEPGQWGVEGLDHDDDEDAEMQDKDKDVMEVETGGSLGLYATAIDDLRTQIQEVSEIYVHLFTMFSKIGDLTCSSSNVNAMLSRSLSKLLTLLHYQNPGRLRLFARIKRRPSKSSSAK